MQVFFVLSHIIIEMKLFALIVLIEFLPMRIVNFSQEKIILKHIGNIGGNFSVLHKIEFIVQTVV